MIAKISTGGGFRGALDYLMQQKQEKAEREQERRQERQQKEAGSTPRSGTLEHANEAAPGRAGAQRKQQTARHKEPGKAGRNAGARGRPFPPAARARPG